MSIKPDNDTDQPAVTIYRNTTNFMSKSDTANLTGGELKLYIKFSRETTLAILYTLIDSESRSYLTIKTR